MFHFYCSFLMLHYFESHSIFFHPFQEIHQYVQNDFIHFILPWYFRYIFYIICRLFSLKIVWSINSVTSSNVLFSPINSQKHKDFQFTVMYETQKLKSSYLRNWKQQIWHLWLIDYQNCRWLIFNWWINCSSTCYFF